MLILSKLSISINLDLFNIFFEFIETNLWSIFSFVVFITSLIILMAGRSTDKILKGLQGTASATVIARGAIDAYKTWENSTPDENDEESEDKKDNKKETNKTEDTKKEEAVDSNKSNER